MKPCNLKNTLHGLNPTVFHTKPPANAVSSESLILEAFETYPALQVISVVYLLKSTRNKSLMLLKRFLPEAIQYFVVGQNKACTFCTCTLAHSKEVHTQCENVFTSAQYHSRYDRCEQTCISPLRCEPAKQHHFPQCNYPQLHSSTS